MTNLAPCLEYELRLNTRISQEHFLIAKRVQHIKLSKDKILLRLHVQLQVLFNQQYICLLAAKNDCHPVLSMLAWLGGHCHLV